MRNCVEITKDSRVSEILREYGDIAEVMELFGMRDRDWGRPALGGRALPHKHWLKHTVPRRERQEKPCPDDLQLTPRVTGGALGVRAFRVELARWHPSASSPRKMRDE